MVTPTKEILTSSSRQCTNVSAGTVATLRAQDCSRLRMSAKLCMKRRKRSGVQWAVPLWAVGSSLVCAISRTKWLVVGSLLTSSVSVCTGQGREKLRFSLQRQILESWQRLASFSTNRSGTSDKCVTLSLVCF